MNIAYVLDQPQLCGGVKVVFQHAAILRTLGHRVTVLANGPRPAWIGFAGTYVDMTGAPPRLPPQDLVVATYWTTVAPALALGAGPVVHFCQGYEGDCPHLADRLPAIEAAYRHPIPAWVVAPHLGELVAAKFDKPSMVVPPPLDALFAPRWRLGPRRHPRVLLHGIFEAPWKHIPAGLDAVRRLRATGIPCRLTRISTFPLSAAERAQCEPDRYILGAPPATVARLTRSSDLLLFPSSREEGFGLPALEAMAAGVPVVAASIPSLSFMTAGALPLVPPGDAAALAEAAARLLGDAASWRRARAAGLDQARRFHPRRIAASLAQAVAWALETSEPTPS